MCATTAQHFGHSFLILTHLGDGEMAQQFNAHAAALPEDLSSIPSIHVEQLTTAFKARFTGAPMPFSAGTHNTCTWMHVYAHIHTHFSKQILQKFTYLMYECFVYIHGHVCPCATCICLRPAEARRHQTPWNWSHGQLCAST